MTIIVDAGYGKIRLPGLHVHVDGDPRSPDRSHSANVKAISSESQSKLIGFERIS